MSKYSAVSLFSGCGGSDLGLEAAGVETVWSNEIDPAACELFERVTGRSTICNEDIRKIDIFPTADILVGCYPCTGYSQAGRRNQEDQINYLYQDFDRALRQIRPVAFIVENVDGMRFGKNRTLLDNQLVRFRLAGYRVNWQVLNAADFGLAQHRKRLFIVGIRTAERKQFVFPAVTHGEAEGLKKRKTLRDVIWDLRKAEPGSYDDEPFHSYYLSRNRRRLWSQQSPCVVAHWRHVGLHPDSPPLRKVAPDHWEFAEEGEARRYSYLECAALQGFPNPASFDKGTVKRRFRAIGNAVPPPLFKAVATQLIQILDQRERTR